MVDEEKYTVKAAQRCFQILDIAASLGRPFSVNEVCEKLEVNANMAFRLLATTVSCGYLNKNEQTSLYSLSLKALQFSSGALASLDIRKYAMPYLELLWRECPKANVNLSVFYNGDVIQVDRIDSSKLPRTYFSPGKTVPFHCTGMGKILTCELSDDEVDALIKKKGLKSFTEKTITRAGPLHAELAKVRAEQIAHDREEYILNDNCIAAPIRDADGKICAAMSISAFTSYMKPEEMEAVIPRLQSIAQQISAMTGFQQ